MSIGEFASSQRNWDFGGKRYVCFCVTCGERFLGRKDSRRCRMCWDKSRPDINSLNVAHSSHLKGLGEIAEAAGRAGARMDATSFGFLVSRPGSPNETLRRDIQDSLVESGGKAGHALWKRAWGCGENMDGGLHVVTSR